MYFVTLHIFWGERVVNTFALLIKFKPSVYCSFHNQERYAFMIKVMGSYICLRIFYAPISNEIAKPVMPATDCVISGKDHYKSYCTTWF